METAVIEKISNVARVKADYAKSSFLKCFVYSMFAGAYSRKFFQRDGISYPRLSVSIFVIHNTSATDQYPHRCDAESF